MVQELKLPQLEEEEKRESKAKRVKMQKNTFKWNQIGKLC